MPINSCKKRDIVAFEHSKIADFGFNLLINSKASVIDRSTGKAPVVHFHAMPSETALKQHIDSEIYDFNPHHIDIFAESVDLIFDLKTDTVADTLVFTSFFNDKTNYSVGEFAIFESQSAENLFDQENQLVHEIGSENWQAGNRNSVDWIYDIDGSFRFLGIRIYKSNPTDAITRPESIGIYNTKTADDFLKSRDKIKAFYTNNILLGLEPKAVTDGNCYSDIDVCNLEKGEELLINAENTKNISEVYIITKGQSSLSVGGITLKGEDMGIDRYYYYFDTDIKGNQLLIKAEEKAVICAVGANTNAKELTVDFSDIITEDFLGIGANVLPMAFMPESLDSGFNKVHWELEKRRTLLVRPNVVRIWFQPDWLCDTYEQYKNGEYNFDNQKLNSVYKYLDMFLEAGSEIEFNFGWKVSSHAQEWFSFEGTSNKRNSAPKDVELFAKCCGATLYELIKKRGYSNIKYLTFYNEPDYARNSPEHGDFIVIGCERKVYWEKILRSCRKELDSLGLNGVKMWGCEQSGGNDTQQEWFEYFDQNCSDVLDMHTCHRYSNHTSPHSKYLKMIKASTPNLPTMITECGQYYSYLERKFDMNHIQFFCQLANAGISGALIWCLSSVFITDPCSFQMRNFIDMWDSLQYPNAIENVREVFYEWAMLCRYIPKHSSSVKTSVNYGEDMRCCAFKVGEDDYTVVVELNSGNKERQLQINFDRNIGKKMYRHVYSFPHARNGNAILPPVSKELNAGETLNDIVTGDYCAIVYTTLPPVHQIALGSTEIFLSPNETYFLSAENIDGFGDIRWEMGEAIGDGFVLSSERMTIRATSEAKSGDMCAVKAVSVSNPEVYSVAIIKIK